MSEDIYKRIARIEQHLFGKVGLPECVHDWRPLNTHGSNYTYDRCTKCGKERQT